MKNQVLSFVITVLSTCNVNFKKVTNQFRTTLKCYLLKEVSYERWAPMRDPKYSCDLTEERKFLIMCQVVAYTVYMHVCVLARPGLWLLLQLYMNVYQLLR